MTRDYCGSLLLMIVLFIYRVGSGFPEAEVSRESLQF